MPTFSVQDLTQFVDAQVVRGLVRCSRSMAYKHLRAALHEGGIAHEPGTQLRASALIWERYAQRRFGCPSPESTLACTASSGPTAASIPSGAAGTTRTGNRSAAPPLALT